jgi:hypothetical protein
LHQLKPEAQVQFIKLSLGDVSQSAQDGFGFFGFIHQQGIISQKPFVITLNAAQAKFDEERSAAFTPFGKKRFLSTYQD